MKRSTHLAIAGCVAGAFLIGWIGATWFGAAPREPVTGPSGVVTPAVVAAAERPGSLEQPAAEHESSTNHERGPKGVTTTRADRSHDAGVSRVAMADNDDDAGNATTWRPPQTRATVRGRVGTGRVNRGVRRLFGLGPAPRRRGGRAVRFALDAESGRRGTGVATVDALRVVGTTRRDAAETSRVFGVVSTRDTGGNTGGGSNRPPIGTPMASVRSDQDAAQGACCLEREDCVGGLLPQECSALSGRFVGAGTDCDAASCDETEDLFGACCVSTAQAECVEVSVVDCVAAGGVFFGADSLCTQRIDPGVFGDPAGALTLETVAASGCPRLGDTLEATFPGMTPEWRIDAWATAPGGCGTVWSFARCPVPAAFFGEGSDPLTGTACLRGVPLGAVHVPGVDGLVEFGAADLLIRRAEDPFDRCAAATPYAVGVVAAVERLHLASVEPIVVTFDGGQRQELWMLHVEVTDAGGQPFGTLTAQKEHPNGGRFDGDLPFCPRLTFARFGDPQDVRVFDACNACGSEGVPLAMRDVPWVSVPANTVTMSSPLPTDFHPGVTDFDARFDDDGDCNGNGFLDRCDIADAVSVDLDGNGIPDECECAADLDASGDVGFGDVSVILLEWGPCADSCTADLDGNGIVDLGDVYQALRGWGDCG